MQDFGNVYGSFNEMAADKCSENSGMQSQMSVFNMTRVVPKVTVSDSKLQAKLDMYFIGCYQREYEEPHVTVRQDYGERQVARLRLKDGSPMEASRVDADVIKAVQADMRKDPDKYIENWNDNNYDHKLPLTQEKSHEQPQKDESWKEAEWYKTSQQVPSLATEEGARKEES